MMNDLQNTAQEKSVLRWGGLAGMVGGIIFSALGLYADNIIGRIVVSFVGALVIVWLARQIRS